MPTGTIAEPRGGGNRPPQDDDPFIRAVTRLWGWAARNTTTVVVLAVVLILGIGSLFYYRSYQQNLEERATSQLQTLRARIASGDTGAVGALETFVSRFGGTTSGMEARIYLARQRLAQGRPDEARSTVEPVVEEKGIDTPTGIAARRLLAEAAAASGDTGRALEIYRRIGSEARFSFERRQADVDRARLLAAQGQLREALGIYERLADSVDPEEASRPYAVRVGELRARIEAGSSSDSVSGSSSETG